MSPIRCVDSDLDLRECLWVQCATSKGQGAHTSDARLKQARAPAQANPTQEQPAIDGGQCDRPFGVVTTCSPNEPAPIEVPVLALKVMSPDLTSARHAIDTGEDAHRLMRVQSERVAHSINAGHRNRYAGSDRRADEKAASGLRDELLRMRQCLTHSVVRIIIDQHLNISQPPSSRLPAHRGLCFVIWTWATARRTERRQSGRQASEGAHSEA